MVPSNQYRSFLNDSLREDGEWKKTTSYAYKGVDDPVCGIPGSDLKGELGDPPAKPNCLSDAAYLVRTFGYPLLSP